jgi:hypothetical protein
MRGGISAGSGAGAATQRARECKALRVRARAAHACARVGAAPASACARLDEGVDGEDGEVGLALGVVDEVEVDQLFELQVLGLPVFHHVRQQHAHVLAHRHGRNDCAPGGGDGGASA